MTKTAARALESQATVMRLIARKTSVPVPAVYAFDTSSNNEISAPYICTSFIPGETVSKVWFDETGPIPLEDRRLRILESTSRAIAQLSHFSFEKIGSPYEEVDGSLTLDPCYDWHENDDGNVCIVGTGPYDSTIGYLQEHRAPENAKSPWGIAAAKIIDVVAPSLPVRGTVDDFVLSIPDFDSQNIMVDQMGNLTGIIDWDLAQTVPRCVGYCRYPSWITRDWDPLMYGWPKMRKSENSPDELDAYRQYYNEKLGEALQWAGDWGFTKKSHVREAVWIATLSGPNRLRICCKLVQAVMGEGIVAQDVLFDLGTNRVMEEDWDDLKQKLAYLVSH
ncbi:hypothetical protein QBC33DRAFT_546159 [Phialemonium atrogriseum]|uniref:Aminoglycoside phosphotransferase domain-containing protein n=1 Tax=Phialemonium atrogriseum TaxID=1093897 RepID=A0AAJ0FJU3_9PEZI|nr:uncharacterized protein QBC33DRAFT_546159 [Phialemonium atrogriseum]KAK1764834.1 hypothetical protein QBC33DRAFT_546159 [Phialemonium atrogriseum]